MNYQRVVICLCGRNVFLKSKSDGHEEFATKFSYILYFTPPLFRLFAIETLLNFSASGNEYKIDVLQHYSFISNFHVYTNRMSGKSTSVISFA